MAAMVSAIAVLFFYKPKHEWRPPQLETHEARVDDFTQKRKESRIPYEKSEWGVMNDVDVPDSVTVVGTCSSDLAAAQVGEMCFSQHDGDLYMATGTEVGEWRNSRTGVGACD